MVLQLRLGLDHRILPKHLLDDSDNLLSHSGLAGAFLVSSIPRRVRHPARRRGLGVGKDFGETASYKGRNEILSSRRNKGRPGRHASMILPDRYF